ncbi:MULTISPECIES: SDR family NAD(P)-dependent oxidoreductase [Natronorubrum]|uniref:Short-chain dehydrogenase/reductase SDR n=2 Tax=Natronorubrum bangense TaxID=61858 RepID=L9WT89_9EURY|nr:SDR family NAD(P)-dependent oxidoreductase [Natronorubrum bangense]ELY52647.1 short-chain dehydrogenase/reductase SDR [Natronorubrum bangense JCM 10635]QCC55106.1 SDR family NAD(P)-dependent oxidoreductase [Natronorubrum bangense]
MTDGAIVVGASSGIGEALAQELAAEGYEVGLTARRTERLVEIGAVLPTNAYVATMDVTDVTDAREGFDELVDAMPSVDLVVISAGVGHLNRDLEWEPERETVDVNVRGFTALATAAMAHFDDRGAGHLVGLSSVAAVFGNGSAPAYNASKAFVSTYLEGLRYRQAGRESDVTITTVEPGFVDTEMAMGEFWMCSPETAARQIRRAIDRERDHVYVTRRWRLVAWVLNALPERLMQRLFT